MKTVIAQNIFSLPTKESDAICITTNGVIKKDGKAVMGAGVAKQANARYSLDEELGAHLNSSGNVPYIFSKRGINNAYLISFPTKYHWNQSSDVALIVRSAVLLVELVNRHEIKRCFLTPPGCGLGNLDWVTQVKPVLENILDNRFVIVFQK